LYFIFIFSVLGFNIKKPGTSSSDLPNLPEGLLVNLSSLGGNTGKGENL
jgi:hypothetical protein